MTHDDQRRLANELFARREDEGEWSDKPEGLKVSRTPSVVYSIRFSRSELEELRAVADAEGVSLAELVRRSALTHVREADIPNASVSTVRKHWVFRRPSLTSVRTQNWEPDERPSDKEPVTSATVP